MKRVLALLLALAMTLSLTACGGSADSGSSTGSSDASAEKVVNIGATDTLTTINPLNMDWAFISLYADSLMFLPLVAIGEDISTQSMLAKSVTTEDNIHFDVELDENAVWSDGTPVTVDDVIFTILAMSSPEVANFSYDFSMFEGFGDDGRSPSGATEIEGLVKIDDTHMQFVTKYTLGLSSFINNVATWICILPAHILQDVPADQLSTYDWFNHPDVVDGPYFLDDYDSAHYISYHANTAYFRGAPNIDKLNIRIVQGSELLAGLQSGEIDFIQPSIANIPLEDRDSIEELSGITAQYASATTNEMTFFNTRTVTDARVRKAFVMGIDREGILEQLLGGNGEITEGFVCSSSPYYDASKSTIPYDPEGAKALLEEAGWDGSQTIQYYVSSSDEIMVRAVQVIQQELAEIGISIEIHTVDFATLMSVAGTDDVDVFSVQYTITPTDYFDADSLVNSDDSWTGGYRSDDVDAAITASCATSDPEELTALYLALDEAMVRDVPMFSLYFTGNLGAVSDRLVNAHPTLYGAFADIEQWDLAS